MSFLIWAVGYECPLGDNSWRNIFLHVVYASIYNLKNNASHLTEKSSSCGQVEAGTENSSCRPSSDPSRIHFRLTSPPGHLKMNLCTNLELALYHDCL